MAVKTKQQIIDDATALIPDNTNHEVSPADIRQRIIDVVDSSLFTEELPDFATVATTGSYNDLTNKPTYATVANTGSYNDLTNKPVYANVASTGQYVDLINKPVLATVATSGAYSDLTGKPTLGSAAAANSADFAPNTAVMPTRTITASTGLTGGGSFAADRTIALNANTVASLAKADSAVLYANTQTLTPAEQGQARANIGADVLSGYRNKIINGNFDIWQRGEAFSNVGNITYTADRWRSNRDGSGANITILKWDYELNSSIPGNMFRNVMVVEQTVLGSGVGYSNIEQSIEDVRTLSGKKATLTFYARAPNGPFTLPPPGLKHFFGTGGSPSAATNILPEDNVGTPLTTSFTKCQYTFNIPSVADKVLGTNKNDCLFVCVDCFAYNSAIQAGNCPCFTC